MGDTRRRPEGDLALEEGNGDCARGEFSGSPDGVAGHRRTEVEAEALVDLLGHEDES